MIRRHSPRTPLAFCRSLRSGGPSLLILGLSLLALLSLGACGATKSPDSAAPDPVKQYTEADNYTTVSAAMGDTLQLTLNEDQATGETWRLRVSDGLTIVDSKYSTIIVGMDRPTKVGQRTWTIKATAQGTQKIEGFYNRQKILDDGATADFSLTVAVK